MRSDAGWLVLIESNTTGSGRAFCRAARALGLRPVVLTADPTRYPYLAGDLVDYQVLDTLDQPAVLAACTRLAATGLAGVTSSSEYFAASAAEVAAALGLPGPSAAATRACRSKHRQRQLLADAGVAVPGFRLAGTAEQAAKAAAEIGLPVVVKPTMGSGSVGVRACTTPAEAAEATGGLLARRADARAAVESHALVEEYVSGAEYSVETFDETVIGVTRKYLGPPPFFVETGHDFPAPLAGEDRQSLVDITVRALAALGLGWGAAHTEVRLTARGPVVIEVNPRLAGGMIPAVIREATGVDLVGCCVARACGLVPDHRPTRDAAAAIRFLVATAAGTVTAVRGVAAASRMPGVRAIELAVATGDPIAGISNSFRDRMGYVIAAAGGPAAAAEAATAALRRLTVRVS